MTANKTSPAAQVPHSDGTLFSDGSGYAIDSAPADAQEETQDDINVEA